MAASVPAGLISLFRGRGYNSGAVIVKKFLAQNFIKPAVRVADKYNKEIGKNVAIATAGAVANVVSKKVTGQTHQSTRNALVEGFIGGTAVGLAEGILNTKNESPQHTEPSKQ